MFSLVSLPDSLFSYLKHLGKAALNLYFYFIFQNEGREYG